MNVSNINLKNKKKTNQPFILIQNKLKKENMNNY